jgi:hypothetical protein
MANPKKKVYSKNALKRRETSKKLNKGKPGRKRKELRFPLLKNRAYLEGLYQVDGMSLTRIGEQIGVSHGVVWAAMKRLNIKLRTRAEAKRSPENKPRKKSPRSSQHTTLRQRLNIPKCPNCGTDNWYTPLKSDTFLCNKCDRWYDATPAGDTVTLAEHVDAD